jgi:hypothetical protein
VKSFVTLNSARIAAWSFVIEYKVTHLGILPARNGAVQHPPIESFRRSVGVLRFGRRELLL